MFDRRDPLTRPQGSDGERGAILVLALAFLTAILITAVALLQMSFTSSASLAAFRSERVLRYSGDAALQSGINYLQKNPMMATKGSLFVTGTATPTGTIYIPVEEFTGGEGEVNRSVKAGSMMTLDWEVPADVASSGEKGDDGGQKPREAILTVTCRTPADNGAHDLQACSTGGGTPRVVARARVRFDIDYGTNFMTGVQIPAGQRAIVPKVVWWSSKG